MIINSIKIAWKVLLRHPFYTFITLFGITLTLTVLMVLTSFVDHLFGSHYPENKRERSLYITQAKQLDPAKQGKRSGPMSFDFLTKYAKSLKTAKKVSIMSSFGFANTYANGKRIDLNIKYTDADFWQVTNFNFKEGKPYNARNVSDGDRVVVITDALQESYFENNGKPVVGKTVDIENISYKVIGVVKGSPVTRPYTYADVYFPYTAPKSNYQNKGVRGSFMGIILAGEKTDLPAIQSEFDQTISQIPKSSIAESDRFPMLIVKANNYMDDFVNTLFSDDSGKARYVFYTVVGLLILMFMGLPAINLVNVNVSRIMERASEIGVRKAFGAPAKTLLWQFIVENVFITLIGGFFALILSLLIILFINSSGWIAYADLTINFTVFAVSFLVSLIFGLLSGVLPAYRMSKLKIVDALKS